MMERLHVQRRRSGVTSGTPHADSVQDFLVIDVLAPGSSAFVVPVFYDKYAHTPQAYFFGNNSNATTPSVQLYDPFHICCAFGPEEIDVDDGWVEGDIVRGRWNQYRKRYEVSHPYGLTRTATLSAGLTVGSNAAAVIQAHKRDGTDLASLSITLYHWGSTGDNIPAMPVMATYESTARRWYTDAFYRA